jgi:hypothetical protein
LVAQQLSVAAYVVVSTGFSSLVLTTMLEKKVLPVTATVTTSSTVSNTFVQFVCLNLTLRMNFTKKLSPKTLSYGVSGQTKS